MTKAVTKISFVEDREDMLQFLEEIFTEAEDFECLQSYKNAENAITFLPRSDADLVIVDIGLPGKNGIECVKCIKEIRPEIQFLMYTVFDQEDKIFESLKVGANGYLMKTTESEEILRSARELVNGGAPMSPSIARKIITTFRKADEDLKELDLLSTRENEILQLLSQGLTYKEIAKKTFIVVGTVKQHIHNIYKKMHVKNRTQAINKYRDFINQ